jgi:hypothetical protein
MDLEVPVKNIMLSADERLIEAARRKAQHRQTTLNAEFRRWLEKYASGADFGEQRVRNYRILMGDLAGGDITRLSAKHQPGQSGS